MNFQELRAYLNIPRDATYKLVNDASFFPAQKVGKCWHIDVKKLMTWIELQHELCGKEKRNGKEKRK